MPLTTPSIHERETSRPRILRTVALPGARVGQPLPEVAKRSWRILAQAWTSPMGAVVAAFRVHHTPLGTMFVAASGGGIAALAIDGDVATFTAELSERLKGPVLLDQQGIPETWQQFLDQAIIQIDEYVAGARTTFALPLDWRGLSSFERRVLEALSQVPAGTTLTYGELAERIGEPGAARAVGGALGRNPLALLLPCHRIVAADGTLGGYGGGWRTATSPDLLDVKRALLAHEGAWPPPLSPTGQAAD